VAPSAADAALGSTDPLTFTMTKPQHRLMRMGAGFVVVAALAIVLAGCTTSDSGTVTGLIVARYSQCAQEGETLAGYLTTGHPTSYDPNWGDYRQYALSLSGQSQALYVRQEADSVIEQCDTYESNQAQARAAQAQARAEQAVEAAAVAKATPACKAVGGSATAFPHGGSFQLACEKIDYIDLNGQTVDGSTSVNPETGTLTGPLYGPDSGTEQQCSSGTYDVGPGPTGRWNAVLGACLASS
jgi:hypothetical protein